MNQQHKPTLPSFRRSESGAVLMLGALALPVLILAVAGGIEFSKLSYAKSQLNNGLEQAVIAAAATHAADPTTFGREYLVANMSEAKINATINSFQITTDGSKWTGRATATMNTYFSNIVSTNKFVMNSTTHVEWDNTTTTELVAMVDVSGTMCADFESSTDEKGANVISFVPDKQCNKLDMMQTALGKIIETGTGYSQGNGLEVEPAYKVGILPFTYKIKVANPSAIPSFMTKGETDAGYAATYFTNLSDAEATGDPIPAVTPLLAIRSEADKTKLKQKIAELNKSDAGSLARQAWKRSSLATEMAGLMLDPRYNAAFGGEKPAAFGTANVKKIVIMMTDSANLGCCYTNYPADNYTNNYIYSYSNDHKHLVGDGGANLGICKQMKDAGIEIYTILLDVDRKDMDSGGEEIVDAFAKCATDSTHAFEIPIDKNNPAPAQEKLNEAYNAISRELVKLRVVQQ